MAYKHGDKIVSSSIWFRAASFITFYGIILFPAVVVAFLMYKFRVHGRYNLKKLPKAITVSNHTLFFDPIIIATTPMPKRPYQTFLEATASAPFVGTLSRLLGGVPLPSRDRGFKKLLEGCNIIFRKNNYLHFYPEGECYLYNGEPKKFHPGAFYVAAKLDLPVVPMATVFNKRGSKPVASVYIMEPVYPGKYEVFNYDGSLNEANLKTFTNDVHKIISDKIVAENGTNEFYKGHLERIKGIND